MAVYDALVVLNLCWIMIISALAPYWVVGTRSEAREIDFQNLRKTLSRRHGKLLLACSITISFVAAFGLWVFITLPTFDNSPKSCTSGTMTSVVGYQVHVDNATYRRLWIAVYCVVALPCLNLVVIGLILLPFVSMLSFPLGCFHLLAAIKSTTHTLRTETLGTYVSDDLVARCVEIGHSICCLFLSAIFIILNEGTKWPNNVESIDRQWSLGQIFVLFGALFPVFAVLSKVIELVRGCVGSYRKTAGNYSTNLEALNVQASSSLSSLTLAEP